MKRAALILFILFIGDSCRVVSDTTVKTRRTSSTQRIEFAIFARDTISPDTLKTK